MTTPDEQLMALKNINRFLRDLAYMRNRKDRQGMIHKLLRHYPSDWEIESYWKKAEDRAGG